MEKPCDHKPHLLMKAYCCREWPVDPRYRLGRCGYCRQIPVIIGEWDKRAPVEEDACTTTD